jgi:hypothetical protein
VLLAEGEDLIHVVRVVGDAPLGLWKERPKSWPYAPSSQARLAPAMNCRRRRTSSRTSRPDPAPVSVISRITERAALESSKAAPWSGTVAWRASPGRRVVEPAESMVHFHESPF